MRLSQRSVVSSYHHVTRLAYPTLLSRGIISFHFAPFALRSKAPSWRSHTFGYQTRLFELHSPDNFTKDDLLHHVGPYGIHTIDQLRYEADVGHPNDIGSRMIDRHEYRNKFELWGIILAYRQKADGHEGVKAVWRGMKYRGPHVTLTDESDAQYIWQKILAVAMDDRGFLSSICEDLVRQRNSMSIVWVDVVGSLLQRGRISTAVWAALYLRKRCFNGRADILQLIENCLERKRAGGMAGLFRVMDALPIDFRIYDDATALLWEQVRPEEAFDMHRYLLTRVVLPTDFESLKPFVSHLAQNAMDLKPFLHGLQAAGVSFSAQAERHYSQERSRTTGLSPDTLNILASRTLGLQPRKLSDEFIARAFATGAVAFDFVLSSLRLMGMIEVGPLTFRQIAMSSPDLQTIKSRIDKIEQLDIDTGSSAFVRILKRLCASGNSALLHAIVHSDQHHDCFEDRALQKQLLATSLRSHDWSNVNMSLLILNHGRFGREIQEVSNNLLLEAAIVIGDWRRVLSCMANMRQHGHNLRRSIVSQAHSALFPGKHDHDKKSVIGSDNVGLLIAIWQQAMAGGIRVPPAYWTSPLLQLSKTCRFDDLEDLILWLVDQYSENRSTDTDSPVLFPRSRITDLGRILDVRFQRSSVSGTLMNHPKRVSKTTSYYRPYNPLTLETRFRGMAFLKLLHDKHALPIQSEAVRRSFLFCMRQLYSPNYQILSRKNNIARRKNATPLTTFIDRFNELWQDIIPRIEYDEAVQFVTKSTPRRVERKITAFRGRYLRGRKAVVQDPTHQGNHVADGGGARAGDVAGTDAGDAAVMSESAGDDADDQVTVYSDLFHPSYEDYDDRSRK